MYSVTPVFTQVMDFMPLKTFQRCVERYRGNFGIKHFTCLDQFRTMAFAQLTYRESLRDIEACLRAQSLRFSKSSININAPNRSRSHLFIAPPLIIGNRSFPSLEYIKNVLDGDVKIQPEAPPIFLPPYYFIDYRDGYSRLIKN
jgi:hypothetical protein